MTEHPAASRTAGAGATTDDGGESRLNRGFSLRSAFSLAFADVSPIVALYAIFTLGLFSAGPAFVWAFPIVLVGQLLVACVFGELSSRWPYAGSVYQWARHVRGTSWGWVAAWAYAWGLTIALSTLAYGAAGFLLPALGVDDPGRTVTVGAAMAILAAGSVANMVGRRVLKVMVVASIVCEVVGSVGLSTLLLLFHRVNPLHVLVDGFGTQSTGSWLGGPLLVATAYVGWSFVGFEAAGSIAEEVEKPERNVPKAIILSLLCVAAIVMYSSVALVLAIPDLQHVMAAKTGDPVTRTLVSQLGSVIARPLLVLFVIGFLSSFLAVQAAVSRCLWGSARDNALPGSRKLAKLAGPERLPVNAIALTGVVAAVLVLLAGSSLYGVLVNFTTMGFQIAFGVPVVGAAIARLRGKWRPGAFSLGRWGTPVTLLAALWAIAQTVNIAWPRSSMGDTWYLRWSMILTTALLAVAGALVFAFVRKRIKQPLADRLHADGPGAAPAAPTQPVTSPGVPGDVRKGSA
ncbi:APC family permease [Streptomyces sp. NPDC002514]|uniref:APC family permease n=1 Tax=Streptomyces sp. NPDC001270 TaxID=3364554 RepID=UPI00369D3AFB